MIKDGKLELAASYVLTYENSRNRFGVKRTAISRFLEEYHTDRIRIVDPTEFIRICGGEDDE